MQLVRMVVDLSTRTAWGRLSNGSKVHVDIDDINDHFLAFGCTKADHTIAKQVMSELVKEQVSEK